MLELSQRGFRSPTNQLLRSWQNTHTERKAPPLVLLVCSTHRLRGSVPEIVDEISLREKSSACASRSALHCAFVPFCYLFSWLGVV